MHGGIIGRLFPKDELKGLVGGQGRTVAMAEVDEGFYPKDPAVCSTGYAQKNQ